MSKDVLFLATVPSMIVVFNIRNIKMLQKMGYTVHAACNFDDRSAWTDEQIEEYKTILKENNVTMHQIDFPRKPYHPILLFRSYVQIKKLLKEYTFVMMHNQSCVSGILGRIACKKHKMKIVHTEHGFYYFVGGPIVNWIFYPFDKICSYITDTIITINQDDTAFAKKHMRAKNVAYIHGVGIDIDYYNNTVIDKAKMREELGIPENAFVVLSVGELNENKNHSVILKAIACLEKKDIYYIICGEGVERDNLQQLARDLGIEDRFILTGLVKNVNEYYKMADIFAFPSKREGLGLAALEAMASGLAIITSNKNGINDYAEDGKTGFMYEPGDVQGFSKGIMTVYNDRDLLEKFGKYNKKQVLSFSNDEADKVIKGVYTEVLK